jgi:hypothetical protein
VTCAWSAAASPSFPAAPAEEPPAVPVTGLASQIASFTSNDLLRKRGELLVAGQLGPHLIQLAGRELPGPGPATRRADPQPERPMPALAFPGTGAVRLAALAVSDVEAARPQLAPAGTFLVNGGPDRVGVIGSVTRPFCGACDRVRLTADGQIRNCLFANDESDLRTPLRAGADDDQLAAIWRRAVAAKLPGHGINDPGFLQPARPMSAIGG